MRRWVAPAEAKKFLAEQRPVLLHARRGERRVGSYKAIDRWQAQQAMVLFGVDQAQEWLLGWGQRELAPTNGVGALGFLYLIHLTRRLSGHLSHYSGWAHYDQLASRLAQHRAGDGARVLRVARERGIGWKVVRLWYATRDDERRFKKMSHASRYCPLCVGNPRSYALRSVFDRSLV